MSVSTAVESGHTYLQAGGGGGGEGGTALSREWPHVPAAWVGGEEEAVKCGLTYLQMGGVRGQ